MQGPDFRRVGIIDEGKLSAAKKKIDDLLEEVENALEERGIPEPLQPDSHPQSLANLDITKLTNLEVATLHTQYVAYAAYIGNELAKIEGLEEMAKKMLKDTLAELKDALFAKGSKGPEATAAAMRDELHRELDMEHAKLFFMKAIMKRRYSGYVKQAQALSRTIELRKLEFEQTRRDTNIGLTKKPGGFGAPKAAAPKAR